MCLYTVSSLCLINITFTKRVCLQYALIENNKINKNNKLGFQLHTTKNSKYNVIEITLWDKLNYLDTFLLILIFAFELWIKTNLVHYTISNGINCTILCLKFW